MEIRDGDKHREHGVMQVVLRLVFLVETLLLEIRRGRKFLRLY